MQALRPPKCRIWLPQCCRAAPAALLGRRLASRLGAVGLRVQPHERPQLWDNVTHVRHLHNQANELEPSEQVDHDSNAQAAHEQRDNVSEDEIEEAWELEDLDNETALFRALYPDDSAEVPDSLQNSQSDGRSRLENLSEELRQVLSSSQASAKAPQALGTDKKNLARLLESLRGELALTNDDESASQSSELPSYKQIDQLEDVPLPPLLQELQESVKESRLAYTHAREKARLELENAEWRTLTPSAVLTAALKDAGYESGLAKESTKAEDLSYVSPQAVRPRINPVVFSRRHPVSLQSILAKYIQASTKSSPQGLIGRHDLVQVFSARNLVYLNQRSFDVRDVISWAWVVTAETSSLAASRLLMLANTTSDPAHYSRNKAPPFLLMYLLRRRDLTSSSFRLLLIHAWNMLQNVHHARWTIDFEQKDLTPKKAAWTSRHQGKGNYPRLDSETFIRLQLRLIRNARSLWPEALDSIVTTMMRLKDGFTASENLRNSALARLTFLLNRMLALVGRPVKRRPYSSIHLNQRAQLTILRQMTELDPPIMLNREGYQAVVSVHLRHRKTRHERDWALLKSKAWPPYKEEKYGLDAEIGVEYGVSLAKQGLARSVEAGYSPCDWEDAAGILSGWDKDRSPTIQTRAMLPSRSRDRTSYLDPSTIAQTEETGSHTSLSDDNVSQNGSALVWGTRIQATRTVEEAWALFVQSSSGDPAQAKLSSSIYFAMFRKLVFARLQAGKSTKNPRDRRNEDARSEEVTPGDNLDVWRASENPRERVYLAVPPPNEHEFIQDALRRGLHLGGAFLAFCVRYSPSLKIGQRYLRQSVLDQDAVRMLLNPETFDAKSTKSSIPSSVFSAYIRLLCRTEDADHERREQPEGSPDELPSDGNGIETTPTMQPLQQALKLLVASKTTNRPPWYDLLAALAGRKAKLQNHEDLPTRSKHDMQDILTWDSILSLVAEMEARQIPLDFEGLHILSVGLEKAVLAARSIHTPTRAVAAELTKGLSAPERQAKLKSYRSNAERVLRDGIQHLKSIFLRVANNQTFIGMFPTDADKAFALAGSPPPSPGTDTNTDPNDASPPNHIDASFVLPRLLDVPNAANLHAMLRALGLAGDAQGVVDLLRWMARFAPEIATLSAQVRNGRTMTRRALTCARVMLERWQEVDARGRSLRLDVARCEAVKTRRAGLEDGDGTEQEQERYDLVEQARAVVDFVEDWGGWPTDEECERYVGIMPADFSRRMPNPYASVAASSSSRGYYSGI